MLPLEYRSGCLVSGISPLTRRIAFCVWPPLLAQFERQHNAQPSHCCSVYVVGRNVACDVSGQTLCYG